MLDIFNSAPSGDKIGIIFFICLIVGAILCSKGGKGGGSGKNKGTGGSSGSTTGGTSA